MDEAMAVLREAGSVFVLTGAGISVESGLPTFRGAAAFPPFRDADGREYGFEELASPQGFARDPRLVWQWYNERIRTYAGAEPNAAHRALARMERLFEAFTIATQNVDSLHWRAGSKNLIELHGHLREARCTTCSYTQAIPQGLPLDDIRHACGGLLRPQVVWFGEALPQGAWESAADAAASAEVVLLVGTSSLVYPAAALAFANPRATTIEINPEETAATPGAAISLRAAAGAVLPRIADALAVGRNHGEL